MSSSGNSVASSPATATSRRRWPRRLIVMLLFVIGLPAAYYFYAAWSLEREISQALAETDAVDPRFRFEDMQKERASFADEENSALQVVKVVRLLGRNARRTWVITKTMRLFSRSSAPGSAQFPASGVDPRSVREGPEALLEARKLQDMPNGRFATWASDGLTFLLPDQQDARQVCDLLKHDAMLRAQQGDPDGAMASCMAAPERRPVAGRRAPPRVPADSRVRAPMLVAAVERTLGKAIPAEASMRELQGRIRRERATCISPLDHGGAAKTGHVPSVLRGAATAQDPLSQHMQTSWRMRVTLKDQFADYVPALYTRTYPAQPSPQRAGRGRASAARGATRSLRDLEERLDRNERLAANLDFIPLLPPDLTTGCSHLRQPRRSGCDRGGAGLRTSFRLTHQRRPEAELGRRCPGRPDSTPCRRTRSMGQTQRVAKVQDGIVIYSVGHDKTDDGGNLDRDEPQQPGVDLGFRLWDPPQRRQPPRPPAVIVEVLQ